MEWLGQPARLDIDREEDWDACVEQAKALMADQKGWDEKMRAFAPRSFSPRPTTGPRTPPRTRTRSRGDHREQFIERLELDAVQISADGRFEFWFNDGDLFWGHAIHVTGSLDKGAGDGTDGGVSGREVPPPAGG